MSESDNMKSVKNSGFEKAKEEKPKYIKYDYGHLVQQCFVCGQEEVKMKDVSGGIQMFLPVTDKHEMVMTCSRCKSSIRWYWKKSDKIKTEEELAKEREEQEKKIKEYSDKVEAAKRDEIAQQIKQKPNKNIASQTTTRKKIKKDAINKASQAKKPIRRNRKDT